MMRPKLALKLLLTALAVLTLGILFVSLLRELIRDLGVTGGKGQILVPVSIIASDSTDETKPRSYSPPTAFSWKGLDKNVLEVKELNLSLRGKPQLKVPYKGRDTGNVVEEAGARRRMEAERQSRPKPEGEGIVMDTLRVVERRPASRPPRRTLVSALPEEQPMSDSNANVQSVHTVPLKEQVLPARIPSQVVNKQLVGDIHKNSVLQSQPIPLIQPDEPADPRGDDVLAVQASSEEPERQTMSENNQYVNIHPRALAKSQDDVVVQPQILTKSQDDVVVPPRILTKSQDNVVIQPQIHTQPQDNPVIHVQPQVLTNPQVLGSQTHSETIKKQLISGNEDVRIQSLTDPRVGRPSTSLHHLNAVQSSVSASSPTQEPPTNSTLKEKDFSIKSYLSVPLPAFTRTNVLQQDWVVELQHYLSTLKMKQVSVVTANEEHELVVLNWLISAVVVSNFSLQNTLVLSLSANLASLLRSKGIPVILVEPRWVIADNARSVIRSGFSQVHIVRLTFFRLMNHWGYDLVWYDSDAIVLRDPQPLFDKYPDTEIIGSAGQGPSNLARVWGRTICTGVLLMRSSHSMELYWEMMSQISRHPFTDQGLVNLALKAVNIHWRRPKAMFSEDQLGQCDSGLKAAILSEEVICRYSCNEQKREQYYVWHKPAIQRQRTVANKIDRAQAGHAWFLRQDWRAVRGHTGTDWLRAISENTNT